MALFTKPSEKHLHSLFRVGFAARLRSETADIFLSIDAENKITSTNNRSESTVFYFTSADAAKFPSSQEASGNNIFSLKTAVLAKTKQKDQPFYCNLDNSPLLSTAPRILNVTLVTAPHTQRILFSLSSIRPHPQFLSLWRVPLNKPANSRPNCTKFELFHFEIVPATIGRDIDLSLKNPLTSALTPAQSLTHILLELGIRFRVRSTHGRVLRATQQNQKTPCNIYQDDSKTSIGTSTEKEIIFTSFLIGKHPKPLEHSSSLFVLRDAISDRVFKLRSSDRTKAVDNSNTQSPVILNDGKDHVVRIRLVDNAWGVLAFSIWNTKLSNGSENDSTSNEWLMAGRRGGMEMRHHQSSWETFTLEFVQQSFDATIAELQPSEFYSRATIETRTALRSAIAASIAAARGEKEQLTEIASAGKKSAGGFNHAAALAGFGETPTKANTKTNQKGVEEGVTATATKKKSSTKKASGNSNSSAAISNIPRNVASKKAKQSKRKRSRNKNAGNGSSTSVPSSSKVPADPTASVENSKADQGSTQVEKSSEDEKPKQLEGAASTAVTETASRNSGMPCAACGRSLDGPYTTAMGKQFHAHCFCCGRCRRPMGIVGGQFRERGGIPYCNSCYATHLASRCARCAQPILETVVTAMEKTWHKDCLTCTICRLPLTQTFWLYADKPNEPRCSRCVTGEEYTSRRQGNTRMVNLPLLGKHSPSSSGPFAAPPAPSTSSRVPLRTPNFSQPGH